MLSSAATFSFFLAIGSVCKPFMSSCVIQFTRFLQVIRSDSPLALRMEAMQLQMAASNPILRSKVQSAHLIRARWAEERAARSNN
jgi:hypothetical protein